jgi:hypothetical protein
MFHVSCSNQMFISLKTATNAVECMNVTLLHSKQRHVSATHVAIFRVLRTRIQINLIRRKLIHFVTVDVWHPRKSPTLTLASSAQHDTCSTPQYFSSDLPSLQQTHADGCSSSLVSTIFLFHRLKLSSPPPPPPNRFLFTVDTLRCYIPP